MSKVKVGLTGLKPSDLVAKSIHIESKMEGNALFATPTPALADVTAARLELETRITAAAMGDRAAIALRKDQEKVLQTLLRKLGNYVQIASNSDSDILSSGYEVQKTTVSISELFRPAALTAKRTETEGKVSINWKPVRGGQHYIVEITANDPITETPHWDHLAYTSKASLEAENLIPGALYWFRVQALGSSGKSPFSDPAVVRVA